MTPKAKSVLNRAFDASIQAATWLTAADAAQVEVARMMVNKLENADDPREMLDTAKTLTDILKTLGMNIAGRTGKAEQSKEVTFLDEIIAKEAARVRKAAPTKSAKPRAKPRAVGK